MTRNAVRWRPVLALALALAATGLLWGVWRWSEVRRYRQTLARVENAMDAGLYSLATSDLAGLLERNPRSDEVAFLLGTCERARGRTKAAAEAWAKVPPHSPFSFRALEGLVQLQLEQGRLTAAEQLIEQISENSATISPDPRIFLGPIYCQQGRVRDAMQLIETLWRRQAEAGYAASETAINQLRLYIRLQSNPVPDETIRATLDRAGQVAANDDRIWLWKANLAIRSKSYEEAAQWIDRCLKKRPEDPAVWRTRLDWAVATNRVPAAQAALKHVPAAGWKSAQVEKLAAWFAAQNGDQATEQRALERLIASDPSDIAARDRLIEILVKNGRVDLAAQERRRKDEIAQVQARYRTLFTRNQPRRDAAEMGHLAEQLGRHFEANAFLTIALARAPDRADIRRDLARLHQTTEPLAGSSRTLDELIKQQQEQRTNTSAEKDPRPTPIPPV